MNLKLLGPLTKKYILDYISQEDIFSYYTKLPINLNIQYKSPFRVDNNPTCSFYYDYKSILRLRDFSGDFHGDCFDAVSKLFFKKEIKTKEMFVLVLNIIAKDFRLHIYQNNNNIKIFNEQLDNLFQNNNKVKLVRKTHIYVDTRPFNKEDFKYWGLIAGEAELKYFKVFAVKEAYIQKDGFDMYRDYTYNYKDPCYAYYYGTKDKLDLIRLYYPFRTEKKFLSNNSEVQGWNQIIAAPYGLITKSLKDIITLRSFNIISIAPPSENIHIKENEFFIYKHIVGLVGTLFDYDKTGIKSSIYMRKTFNTTPFFIKNKLDFSYKTKDKDKDIFDYIKNHGREETKKLIMDKLNLVLQDIKNFNNSALNGTDFI